MKAFLLAWLILLAPVGAAADQFRLTLKGAEAAAADFSPDLRTARMEAEAAEQGQKVAESQMLPSLDAEGQYQYTAQVPVISLGPESLVAGTNNNYFVAISANWNLLSLPVLWKGFEAARAGTRAMKIGVEQAGRENLLEVRLAYFRTQLAAAQVALYSDALKLSQSQSSSQDEEYKAGGGSLTDALTASNDELTQRCAFRLGESDLADSLRDLFALTGQGKGLDLSRPMEESVGLSLPARVTAPSLTVALDDSDSLLQTLAPFETAPFKPADLPQLRVLRARVDEAMYQVQADWAGHLPSGNVGFQVSQQYPLSIFPQRFEQQTTSAGIDVPLYSFGGTQARVEQQADLAQADQGRAESAGNEVERDYGKARDRLEALKEQRDLQAEACGQADRLKRLIYQSYQEGSARYLEVETADIRALQANLALANTKTQMLMELAYLAALTAPNP